MAYQYDPRGPLSPADVEAYLTLVDPQAPDTVYDLCEKITFERGDDAFLQVVSSAFPGQFPYDHRAMRPCNAEKISRQVLRIIHAPLN